MRNDHSGSYSVIHPTEPVFHLELKYENILNSLKVLFVKNVQYWNISWNFGNWMWEQKLKIFVELPFVIQWFCLKPGVNNYLDDQIYSHYFPPPMYLLCNEIFRTQVTGAEYISKNKRIIFSDEILARTDGGDIAQQ